MCRPLKVKTFIIHYYCSIGLVARKPDFAACEQQSADQSVCTSALFVIHSLESKIAKLSMCENFQYFRESL